jgi:tetratricopeptide (TPR) repeat protein
MDDTLSTSGTLAALAALFRARRSGVLELGSGDNALRVLLRDGQIAGVGPAGSRAAPPRPRLDDSSAARLERVLREVGIRPPAPTPSPPPAPATTSGLRERLLDALAEPDLPASFEEGARPPAGFADVAGATEPLILEAVRRLRGGDAVRALLGDLDQPLAATAAFALERTLTLTEGYLLSHIDGRATARQVLTLTPLDPEETQRTLLGLLLTGRVESRRAPLPRARPEAEPEPPAPEAEPSPATKADAPAETSPEAEGPATAYAAAESEGHPVETEEAAFPALEACPASDERPAAASPAADLDPDTLARRRAILEIYQSLPLKNHFEVLGVEPGCTDAEVRRAYVALAKQFHPDAQRDERLDDLRDVLEAVFIRVAEAWEVLGDAKSRASYEARFLVLSRGPGATAGPAPGPPSRLDDYAYVPPDEILLRAQLLLAQARYWDAIQMLETTISQMEPRRHQLRGRILLARAYAKNPNWMRKAEDQLQDVVREDPANVDAHYELGLLYKAGGFPARAQAMFRRVLELRPDHRDAVAELGLDTAPGGGGLLKRLFGRGKAS